MKPTRSTVVLLFTILSLATLSAPAQPVGRIDRSKISKTLKGFVDKDELVGVSALITVNGKEAYFGAFGLADREAGRPMRRDTIVQIYSMTKPITGTALMQLWERGKFHLDDPVSKFIPELANVKVFDGTNDSGAPILVAPNRPMTIRDLTRHTSGLTYGGSSENDVIKKLATAIDPLNVTNTLDEFARRLGTLPLEFQPGAKWRYSFAVDVQALLVQRLSGEPFDVYVQEHVLKPLGMTHTGFFVPPERRDQLAAMYNWTNSIFTRDPDTNAFKFNTAHWPLTPGGYGLTSTLDDYTRFARMLLNGGELDGVRILRPDTVRMMSTSQLDPATSDRSWLVSDKGEMGFGVDMAVRIDPPKKRDGKAGEVGEFFWDGAANTLFWVDPKNKLTAVLFTQYKPFGKVPLHRDFRAAVYSRVDPAALPPK